MNFNFAAIALLLMSTASVASEQITPSHVYQTAQQIMVDLEAIRKADNITTAAREPGVQTNKRPLRIFSKSLEVIEKIGCYQNFIGINRVNSYNIPLRKVTPKEAYDQAESILVEQSRISKVKGFVDSSRKIPFIAGKGHSDLYEIMWRYSYLLDDLAGQTSPSEMFRNTSYIMEELNLNNPTPFLASIISFNDALDATNTILAELVHVKVVTRASSTARNLLDAIGPKIVKSLTDTFATALSDYKHDVASAASVDLISFQTARIFVDQFLLSNSASNSLRIEMQINNLANASSLFSGDADALSGMTTFLKSTKTSETAANNSVVESNRIARST